MAMARSRGDGVPVEETRKHFHEQMAELRTDVVRAAAMTSEAIAASTRALLDQDLAVIEKVVAVDRSIDELDLSIEGRAHLLIARQQPTAGDLRLLLAVLRMLHEIELSSDLTVSICKAARRLYPNQLTPRIRGILDRMGVQAGNQMRVAIDAFVDEDVNLAAALADMDDVMDDAQKELFRAIFDTGAKDEAGLQRAVDLALVGRYYERIADHAVQIGRWVLFMVTGTLPEPKEHEVTVEEA